MPRPPTHDTHAFLDAAIARFAEGGTAAVTMSAVARALDAPSGSVYHRFAGRPALLSEIWLRTEERFHESVLAELRGTPALEAAISTARQVVRWSRANAQQAHVLHAGKRDFGYPNWPAERVKVTEDADKALAEAIRVLAKGLAQTHSVRREHVLLAVIDLPYAAVRRHLAAAERIPPRTEELVEHAARAILTADASP